MEPIIADGTPARSTSSELRVRARDEFLLCARVFEPKRASGTVVVFGATAVPQRFYDRFARYLAERQLRVVTFDYRGIGRSRPPSLRGFEASMTDWARRDASAIVDLVQERFGGPFGFVGHSFGGQLIGLIDEARQATAAVLTGAQFGYFGHFPWYSRPAYAGLWRLGVPVLTRIYGYLPGSLGLGEDLPAGVANEWARWCSHPNYLVGHHEDAQERLARFNVPTVALSATDDDFAPRAAVEALLRRLPTETVTHRVLRPERFGGPIGHFGFYRPRLKDAVWEPIAAYLLDAFHGRAARFLGGDPASSDGSPLTMPTREEILADLNYGR